MSRVTRATLNVGQPLPPVAYHCLACDYEGTWGDECDCPLPKATKRLHDTATAFETRKANTRDLEWAAIEYARAVRAEGK